MGIGHYFFLVVQFNFRLPNTCALLLTDYTFVFLTLYVALLCFISRFMPEVKPQAEFNLVFEACLKKSI
jgi:hypothetical protein